MSKAPKMPESKSYDTPFLNDATCKVEFVDGEVKDGPPTDPVPAFVFNVKVIESTNPMNQVGTTHTVRVKCRGFSWGKTVQEIVGAAGLLPKTAINTEVAEGLLAAGKLKGRKFMIEQKTVTSEKGATYREYKCAALESTAVL